MAGPAAREVAGDSAPFEGLLGAPSGLEFPLGLLPGGTPFGAIRPGH